MAKLTEGKCAKIQLLINQGFSNGEIARALKVSDESVRKLRNGGQNVKSKIDKTSRGTAEKIRNRGRNSSNDANRDQDPGREPGDQNTINDSTGESTTSKTGEGITFIGGKKDMDKKEGSGAKEGDEYQCYNCSYTQGSPFTDCPKCGASNSFEE